MKRPPCDWGSTGGETPDLAGGLTMPQGTNGNIESRKLLSRILALLYSCVGSAQRAKAESEEQHAVYQMVIANAALAAGEGDAFLTLMSAGLEGPACIHLRALGELATRIVVSFRRHDLALKLYKTWPAAWERLVKMQRPEIEFDEASDKSAKDMRQLERTPEFQEARDAVADEVHLINDVESTMWSKRSHGDIYALVQVSVNLARRGSDVRAPIVAEVPYGIMVDVLLVRAIGFALVALNYIIATFRPNVPKELLDQIVEDYGKLQAAMPRVHLTGGSEA
jgi:hypothetical protein